MAGMNATRQARFAFFDWRERYGKKGNHFLLRKTDQVIVLVHTKWDAPFTRGLVDGTLFMEDKWGRPAGTGVSANYLDLEPLSELGVIAWASTQEQSSSGNTASSRASRPEERH